jgi:tripartite-type tricarboxylate transporter receptor subunit TctC
MNAGTGLWAPKKTPREIIRRLNDEIRRIAETDEIKERLYRVGAEPWTMTPEECDAYTLREIGEMRKMVEAAGIKSN